MTSETLGVLVGVPRMQVARGRLDVRVPHRVPDGREVEAPDRGGAERVAQVWKRGGIGEGFAEIHR